MSYTGFDFPHTHYYDSDLREVLDKLKFLLKEYDGLVNDIAELNEWKTTHEGEYVALLKEVQRVSGEIDGFEAEVNQKFDELSASLYSDFDELKGEVRNELASTITEINNLFSELKAQMEQQIFEMKQEISRLTYELQIAIGDFRNEMEDYIDKRFDLFVENLPDYEHLIVWNPIRGYQTTVQIAINDLYSMSNFWGLTASEFDSLNLTCEEFESYELTCHEFDNLGYKLLNYPDPNTHMLDPFDGTIKPIKEVVMELYGLHMGGLTAAEFDALDLTAEEFDAKEVTAFEFDFFGREAA